MGIQERRMKVYLVWESSDMSNFTIEAAFDTLEKARAFAAEDPRRLIYGGNDDPQSLEVR